MAKEMVISASAHETRVAILEDGQLCEIYVEREKEFALVGSIYKGRVTRVLPGMQSSFVDIGLDSDAFLYVSDVLETLEEYDQIVTTVEDKVKKMQDQGGEVFPSAPNAPAVTEPTDVEEVPSAALPAQTEAPPPDSGGREAAFQTRPPSQSRPFDRHGRGGGGMRGRGRRGGQGRDRRFGRELPPSKYASHRPSEPWKESPSSIPASGENYVPVILPGESLARFKNQADALPNSGAETDLTASTGAVEIADTAPGVERETELHLADEHRPLEEHVGGFPPFNKPREYSSDSLAPLPGESLSGLRTGPAEVREEAHQAGHEEIHEEAPGATGPDPAEEHEERMAASFDGPGEFPHHEEMLSAASEALELSAAEASSLAEAHSEAEEEAEAMREEMEAPAEGLSEFEIEDFTEEKILGEEEEAMPGDPENAGETAEALASAEAGTNPEGGEPAGASDEQGNADRPREEQTWTARVHTDFRPRMQHPARRGGRDRGGRRDNNRRFRRGAPSHGHRGQPRRPHLISEMLKAGQEIIVQIAKEPLGKKGARITSHVALPGRFLVYMPTLDHTGVSRKIASAEERARLRHLVSEAKGTAGGGFIVRTAAAQASPDEVRTDVEYLTRTWIEIKTHAEQRKAPTLLHRDLNLVERILRDHLSPDFTAIWMDSEEEFTKVVDFVSRFQPELVSRVKLYTKSAPIFEEFGIQQEIDKGLRPKVWLKSGGYIVINHTEALVAIDVNTGKYVGKGSTRLEDTIVRTNIEAVKEIVRQIRLRDLGGIIVIDFIDMEERKNREKVMAALEEALKADRAPSKVLRFNEFGLIAITRKRTKQALERTLCQPCPYCTGSGMVKSIPTLCYEIQAEARKMAPEIDSGSLTLRVHPEIAKALKTRESSLLEELERWAKKNVIIQADPALHWEQYDIF